MDYQEFYAELFTPLEARLGPLDPDTLMAIIGFDEGGPLNLCTIGYGNAPGAPVTYVSCELSVREHQVPNAAGRYELLMSGGDEDWIRQVLTDTGAMSLEKAFEDGDTMDIAAGVDDGSGSTDALQGLLFKQEYALQVGGRPVGVLRAIGITRAEMNLARDKGADALIGCLQQAGVYPHTMPGRSSVA